MKQRELGESGINVSAIGLGCWGMSGSYGPADEAESVATLHHALDLGLNFIDTADSYGDNGHNESLIGRSLAGRRREYILATKTGVVRRPGPDGTTVVEIDGRPERLRRACEASLARLQTDVIDLYYLHRADPNVPIEDSVGALAELIAAGKVRSLGLSEVSEATLRRAHAVHPIAALQSEYSLWTREPEATVMPACRALGIAFVPFSPLGRGFLTGAVTGRDRFSERDWRANNPRFTEENLARNLALLQPLEAMAQAHGAQAGASCLGLGPLSRPERRPDPRHEATDPPGRERGGAGHRTDVRGTGPPRGRLPARCGGRRALLTGVRPLGGPVAGG